MMRYLTLKTGLTSILAIILTILNLLTYAQDQNRIDSLFSVLEIAKADTTQCNIFIEIGDVYELSQPDSAIFYYQKAFAIPNKNSNHKTKQNKRLLLLKATAVRYIGIVYWSQGSYVLAEDYFLKSLKLFGEIDKLFPKHNEGKKGISACYVNIGNVYKDQGGYDKAIDYYTRSLNIAIEQNDTIGLSYCYNNIGIVHYYQGNYDKALEYYLMALKIKEVLNDKNGMSLCYLNIGIIHQSQGNYNSAIDYFQRSITIDQEINDQVGLAYDFQNISVVYFEQAMVMSNSDSIRNNYLKAEEYNFKALKFFEDVNDQKGMSACFTNFGNIYKKLSDYKKAIEYYLMSMKIDESIGDKEGLSAVYGNIASLNISLADSATTLLLTDSEKKQESEKQRLVYLRLAIEYGTKAFELAHEIAVIPRKNEAAGSLMRAYELSGNDKLALKYAKIFIETKDSMFKEDKTKALAGMEAKYQNQKKQLEIDKLGKEKELQLSENKKQRIIILFVTLGLILLLAIAVIIFRSLKITRKQKKIIENQKLIVEEKNHILNQQNEEISAQRDEIEGQNEILNQLNEEITTQRDEIEFQRDKITAQRDMVTQQKNHIEEMHLELTDSINYAKRIQQAVLPTGEYANSILGDHFILFKPKDVVSGDFYWASRVNEWLIVTVADCTGHGVPGAFMSMLGISFLNEIVLNKEVTKASQVLDQLRNSVIDALKQKGDSEELQTSYAEASEVKDGMDMVIIVLNTETLEMQFAGANNPLWIVRNTSNSESADLENYKPDKMPVSIYKNMIPFSNQIIQLQKDDILYLASDGFADQFGGQKNKKFLSKNLKELIKASSRLPMFKQKELLEKALNNWTGDNEQIDDVTIMGIKI